MASPSVLVMLLTTKYVDGLPLYRVEKVLGRHGINIPRQTLARWVIQCGEHFQPLLYLMRDSLLANRVIHCDETRMQVLKGPDREPSSQSWMWVQTEISARSMPSKTRMIRRPAAFHMGCIVSPA